MFLEIVLRDGERADLFGAQSCVDLLLSGEILSLSVSRLKIVMPPSESWIAIANGF